MRRAALVACASAFVLAACGANHDSNPTESASSKIIHGQLDTSANDRVVDLIIQISDTEAAACSGTLIAPDVIVTARHCVSDINEQTFAVGADFTPGNIWVYTGVSPKGKGLGGTAPIAKGKKIVHDSSTTLINHDLGIIVTDGPVSNDFSQIRLSAPPTKNEAVFDVGYGMTENDTTTSGSIFHDRYIKNGLTIAIVGPSGSGTFGVGSAEIEIKGESICEGDSGGPVFDTSTGALLAANSRGGNGVSSSPPAACEGSTATNIMTRVDAFADLIRSTLAAQGEIPWEEGQPKPTPGQPPSDAGSGTPDTGPVTNPGGIGAPCTGPTDCQSGTCIDIGSGPFCSAACSDSSQCPTNYSCTSGYCIPSAPVDPGSDAGTVGGGGDASGIGATPDANTSSSGGCSVATNGSNGGASSIALVGLVGALAVIARRRRG